MAHTYRLDNGLTVVIAPHRVAPVVAMQAWVGVGSADEGPREAGIAHAVEHMLFKGTAKRGVGEVTGAIEAAGGDINAWTSFDQTVMHVVVARRSFDVGLDVLADTLIDARLDAGEWERERAVILEEIRQSADDPVKNVARALFDTAFVAHPYRRPVIGSAERVRAITRRQLMEFYRSWYVAGNTTLVIAGDVDEDHARAQIARAFARMPEGAPRRRPASEPPQVAPRARVLVQDVREAYLGLGFHAPPLASPDSALLDVAAVVLGQGQSSRLERTIQRDRQLVTGVWAYQQAMRDPGLFVISATARARDLRDAVRAIGEELVAVETIGSAEVDKAKAAIEADQIYQLETAQGVARKLGWYHATAGDVAFERVHLERVRAATPASVRAAVRRHLVIERASVAATVPRAIARGDRARTALARSLVTHARRGMKRVAKAPAAQKPKDAVVREVLPNGMVVLIKPDPSVPVVAMRAVWPGGVRLEDASTNGITSLLAHWITRGCGDRDAAALTETIDRMGGGLAGAAGRNSFGLRAEWLARSWDQGLDLLADCVIAPRFDGTELAGERRRLLDDLGARDDSASAAAFRLFSEALYKSHPYRLDVAGSPDAIATLDADTVAQFYRDHFPVGAMTLAIVGDVDPDQVLARVRARFGAAPKAKTSAPKVAKEQFADRKATEREVYRYLDREQAHLVIGFPGTTVDSPDRFALEVLATILGGPSGRLFAEVRDRQGLAYRVSAHSAPGLDPGYVAIYLSCSPDAIDRAQAAVTGEIDRVVADGVTDDEVARAVTYLVGAHEVALQRRSAVATALAFHEAYGLGWSEWSRYPDHMHAVTAKDVARVAKRYLSWDLAVTATVRPPALSPGAAKRARLRQQIDRSRHEHPPRRPKENS
ncbi:MAG TPA: pitrilysin family protein [Kofleriaceae bacterium]|nr:pitrilysin family protein [Kofleriaceae bacterium]